MIPRRNRVYEWTPAERAIQDAVDVVERAGAHPLLTDAVTLLAEARAKVADFVDGPDDPMTRLRSQEPRLLLRNLWTERYWCGCRRESRWDRCERHVHLELDEEPLTQAEEARRAAPVPAAPAPFCHSGRDGDCDWSECPQNRDAEPDTTGRSCPLFPWDDDDAARSVEYRAAAAPAPEATRGVLDLSPIGTMPPDARMGNATPPEATREADAPSGSCLVCGHLREFAVWHETAPGQPSGAGVCKRCRDARHVISGGAVLYKTERTHEEFMAALARVLEHYLGDGAPEYGDARFLCDYALTVENEMERLRATVAAQAPAVETLRADKARLERELADLRQMHALRGRMNDEMREIIGRIFDVLQPHIETLCAARAPEPQPPATTEGGTTRT